MSKIDSILFDVDSTLSTIEGVDWVAQRKGLFEAAAEFTNMAMGGEVKMEEVFGKKINLVAPTKQEMQEIGQEYIRTLVPGVKETIEILQKFGKEVWLITGNYHISVQILADYLKIPHDKIRANFIYFDDHDNFSHVDLDYPLTKSGGKAEIVKKLKKTGQKMVFVGDSVTDLDTKPFVNLFIGFGGVVVRDAVKENSEVFIEEANMLSILDYILTDEEKDIMKKSN
jgi:phosphoserine phosphatase